MTAISQAAVPDSAEVFFHCMCGASHSRGPINGLDGFRCLRCGMLATIDPTVAILCPCGRRHVTGVPWYKMKACCLCGATFTFPSSSPATAEVARSGAPENAGALPHRHGRREDATERSHDAAPPVRGALSNQTPPPPGAEWNVPPDAPYHKSIQVWIDRTADLAIANLRTLARLIDENKNRINLSEAMRILERIDEERRTIRLDGISDAPPTALGRIIDERA